MVHIVYAYFDLPKGKVRAQRRTHTEVKENDITYIADLIKNVSSWFVGKSLMKLYKIIFIAGTKIKGKIP